MTTLTIIQTVLAILVIALVLLQKSGDGIEGALGGGFQTTSVKQKRRGMEKFFFFTLIAVSLLFVISILYSLVNPTL